MTHGFDDVLWENHERVTPVFLASASTHKPVFYLEKKCKKLSEAPPRVFHNKLVGYTDTHSYTNQPYKPKQS